MDKDKDVVKDIPVKKTLTKWSNEPTVQDLKVDYTRAKSFHSEQISKIDYWDDLLNIENSAKPRRIEGRSIVQPKIIRKQAEWRYCALSEPFLATDSVFTIQPKTWLDVEAAKQNELVLNYQFNSQLNKVNIVDNLVRGLVNDGTAIARISWDYEEITLKKSLPNYNYQEVDNPEIIQQIMQATEMFSKQDPQYAKFPDEIKESVLATIENKRPILATIDKYSDEDTVEVVRNQPKIDICDLHNVIIDPTCGGDFDKANFVIYAFETSLSELKRLNIYKNLDKIKVGSNTGYDSGLVTSSGNKSFQYSDEPRKKFVVYEYWGYWDIDDSGLTTPIVATWVDDVMIRMERNPYPDGKLPFVVIPYLPVKNSVYGEPDAVLLEENQKLTGSLVRGMVDVMARSANAQTGIRKDALDAVNRRKFKRGEDYEFNPNVDPRAAILQHTYPELPQSSYSMIQMFRGEAEALTGVKSYDTGISTDSYGANPSAAGVQGILSATGRRESSILRRLSKGLEIIASKILAMNAVWLSDEEVIRITDESFVGINRENLSGSFDIKLTINTPENNALKAQELSFMLQTMGQSLPFELTQILLSEVAHLQNMPQLASAISNYQPAPNPLQDIEMQKAQLELQKLQLEMQRMQADTQAIEAEIQAQQAGVQKTIASSKLIEAQARFQDLEYIERESGVTQERAIQLQQAQAQGNLQRDLANKVMTNQLETQTAVSQAIANQETNKI